MKLTTLLLTLAALHLSAATEREIVANFTNSKVSDSADREQRA